MVQQNTEWMVFARQFFVCVFVTYIAAFVGMCRFDLKITRKLRYKVVIVNLITLDEGKCEIVFRVENGRKLVTFLFGSFNDCKTAFAS